MKHWKAFLNLKQLGDPILFSFQGVKTNAKDKAYASLITMNHIQTHPNVVILWCPVSSHYDFFLLLILIMNAIVTLEDYVRITDYR